MGFHNLEKKNFWYTFFLRTLVAPWFNYIFFRRISVNNLNLIPDNEMLIFTPNHQNALIDAMAPLCNIKKQLVFMARSDIFRKKSIASILYFLKILPIFRIRDGYSTLKKNNAILTKTTEVLNAGNGIVIFPEGSHEWKHKLRPFKKGHARIAFLTAEANDFNVNISIVPIGLNYSDFKQIRSDITINIGEPVMVSEFYQLYQESPSRAILALNEKLYNHLSPLILNITSDEEYEMIDFLTEFYCKKKGEKLGYKSHDGYDGFKIKKEIIQLLERGKKLKKENFELLKTNYTVYVNLLKKSKLKNDQDEDDEFSFVHLFHNTFILAVGFPFFIYGLINNIVPWSVTKLFTRKVKDITFKSSFSYVISLLVFPAFYFLQIFFYSQVVTTWWVWLIYAISLPFSAAFSLDYSLYFKKFLGKLKWLSFKLKNKTAFSAISQAKQELMRSLDNFQS